MAAVCRASPAAAAIAGCGSALPAEEMTMLESSQATAAGPWAPYVPDEKAPWDLRRVVHLHRRAGFAATWDEIQRDLKDGPDKSIDHLLTGTSRSQGVAETFEQDAAAMSDAAFAGGNAGGSDGPERLKGWWVYRMLFGPDPLGEGLTLMWHSHFATSNHKVEDLAAMRRQNELFRKYARAPFADLLHAAVRDPALLTFLDAPDNRKGHPNENLARELMELFTLGIGHYTEADVQEAARALTGWGVKGDIFREHAPDHDDGEKTILGRKGRWTGADLVKLLLEHPATAGRLAFRLCDLCLGENVADVAAVRALADGLRQHNLDVGWAVATVLRSRAFFTEANLGTRVRGPVAYLVGTARALEMLDHPPSTLAVADWSARLGQDLFYPPNVGGWAGGRAWLTTAAAIGRANYAAALVGGDLGAGAGRRPFDAVALARRHGRSRSLDDLVTFYAELLLGFDPGPAWRERLTRAVRPRPDLDAGAARRAVVLLLASPEAQLA
jgi:hypothetical protein